MDASNLSRRNFLDMVGRAGGAAALYETMAAMGLLAVPPAYAGPPSLEPGGGKGTRVVILGAGIAGMVAAYELSRAGYDCTILEARARPGGRIWTLRQGDVVEEIDSRQECGFDQGPEMYFNPGPARIPQHHQALLGYCKQLGVALEVKVNENRNAYFQSDRAFDGKPVRARQFISDTRGYIAELLAKAVSQNALDATLSAEDRQRVLAMAANFGALDRSGRYSGSSRAGFSDWPGVQPGTPLTPLPFAELMKPIFGYFQINWGEIIEYAATMLQPAGGMDRIAYAFERELRPMIQYGAEMRALRRAGEGVRVVYRQAGQEAALAADYCICTIPLPVLAKIDMDVAPDFKRAIAGARYSRASKLGLQANHRFWEDEQIYGGISWTEQDITQIWYPSTGFHAQKGILVGAYVWGDGAAERFARLSPASRNQLAIASGAKIHPDYAQHVAHGISVAWSKIPFSEGAYATGAHGDDYRLLLQPDGPLHLAGEHLSHLTGWMEGAVLSAHAAIVAVDARRRARKP
jgi:monoamine oxidase